MDDFYFSEGYFAAANSRYGFTSRFESVFSGVKRLYIIKGGPGTGKSSLMRHIAREAVERGQSVECFYCSSDPSSLDGVILDGGRAGIWDGTAPHTAEPRLPGADGEFADLGRFWNTGALETDADVLRDLARQKADCYASAYRALAAAGYCSDELNALGNTAVDEVKLNAYIKKLTASLPKGDNGCRRELFTSAISGAGEVRSAAFENQARTVWSVGSRAGFTGRFFAVLTDALAERGCALTVSLSPLDPNIIDGVYVHGAETAFVISAKTDGARYINPLRFMSGELLTSCRVRMKFLEKCRDSLMADALFSLSASKATHDEVERIYGAAMDFERKEAFEKELTEKIFK